MTSYIIGFSLIFVAIVTDILDGILARKLKQISEVGKILDPLADKLAIGSMIVLLVIYKNFPLWVAILVIGRDFLILVMGLCWAAKLKYISASNILGKVTAFFLALMILVYILENPLLKKIFTWNAVIFTIISGISYLRKFIYNIRSSAAGMNVTNSKSV